MTDDMENITSAAKLRKKAEALLASEHSLAEVSAEELDAKRLLHELQVHAIELQMQNEELNRIIAEKSAEMSEHETRLSNIINNTPDGYFNIDPEGRFLDVNQAWLRMHGYDSKDEVIGKNLRIVHVDSDSGSALAYLAELKNGKPIPFGEFASRRKNGSVGHHVFSAHPVVHGGKVVGFEWFIIDISERIQIEEVQSFLLEINALHPGEDFFESLANFLSWTLDMDFVRIDRLEGDGLSARTVVVWCDGHLDENVTYALKDTPCAEVVGKNVCSFPGSVCQLFPRDQVLQNLRAESYIGVTLWSHTFKPIGLISVISRRPLVNPVQAENIMTLAGIRAAGEMERIDASEVQQNLEKQIRHAQKLESLGVLAGGIAHDFNNILAVIIGHCGLVKLRPEKAADSIVQIEKAAERAAELCRQMLAYAGKTQTVITRFDMTDLVDGIVRMLRTTTPQNVVIRTEFSADIPRIMGDASQITQIVMNLIINAFEAIGEARGEISVLLAMSEIRGLDSVRDHSGKNIADGRYVCLEVSDTGCGMDNETLGRIFEPFYTTKFTGRGLGMAATLGIITTHKGFLQLESELGKGTTFKVYLPAQATDSVEEETVPQEPSTPWQGSGTILLVEDEELIRTIVKTMVEILGFSVLEASNGKEALELFRGRAVDITLVMTDVGMPVMNGYELIHELRKLDPHVPIIISSGFGDADVTAEIAGEDIAGLVSKPYKFEQLREMLQGVIGNTQCLPVRFLHLASPPLTGGD